MREIEAIVETAIYVGDLEAAEAFYRDVLGLEVEVRRGDAGTRASGYMEFDAGGTAISLTQSSTSESIFAQPSASCRRTSASMTSRAPPSYWPVRLRRRRPRLRSSPRSQS